MEGWGEEEDTGAAALVEAGLSATGCSDFEQAARSRKPASMSGIEVFFTDSSKDFGARAARIIPLAQEAKFRDEADAGCSGNRGDAGRYAIALQLAPIATGRRTCSAASCRNSPYTRI